MGQGDEVFSAPFEYTLSIIGGKWKMIIMFWLSKRKIMRYGELKKSIKGITHKMLSSQLKELESEGIIIRKEYHQIPPKVEYSLSEKGETLMPILEAMCNWGHAYFEDN
ncbi:winged helix-turn-helix transcriptional regulator [Desulfosporosinus metallidurans]|uniref:Transcriptional regulator, HxlR family n=1 Tax=Desulfosporosinus metallidurans TaxID=1888891 RepID=A0A1Q8QU34_9FIRM|nr:helix-turn-helix domain-containing protein [Desulfosporosinus metallidurans]OLN30812.1 Transcriptional regulator, HxlR family [Desulfosporosinus metallidurans]